MHGSNEEIFVHQRNILAEGFRNLREGEDVEFEVSVGLDGKRKACLVTGPDGAPPQGTTPLAHGGSEGGWESSHSAGYDAYSSTPPGSESTPPLPYKPHTYMHGMVAVMADARACAGMPRPPPPEYCWLLDPYTGCYVPPPCGPGYYPNPMMVRCYLGGHGSFPSHPRPRTATRGQAKSQSEGNSSGLQVVVHNLPWDCTWQQLRDAFLECGEVERADVMFDSRGRSRGFGVVRFSSKDEAVAATEKMNNAIIGGRVVTARIDRFA